MEGALHVLAFAAGLFVVAATLGSALRTVLLPRGVPARLARWVFTAVRALFRLRAGPRASYERRDRIMALYSPFALLTLLSVWLTLLVVGYMGMFWSLEADSLREAFTLSGSSIFTLGFARVEGLPATTLAFTEAALGLSMLALLITYLPSLYSGFSRREALVTMLEVRAGSPPTGAHMLERYWRLQRLDRLTGVWRRWEEWFVDVEESHTSFPALVFFRSPQPDHSWVIAAGAVLDAASITASTIEQERDPDAELCIRAGYIALRRIAEFFAIPFSRDPDPGDPISISRDEYIEVYDRLREAGLPVKADREQAWRDFAGWRVNYDAVLLGLAALTMAPVAPWSSDRGMLASRRERKRRQRAINRAG